MAVLMPDTTNPHAAQIRQFFLQEFPRPMTDPRDLLEAIFQVLMGTNNTRYGPKPSPEIQVQIRHAIRAAVADGEPIPLLVPWGSRKTHVDAGVDVAEVMALRTLGEVAAQIKAFWAPGARINIRIEDLGAWWLWRDDDGRSKHAVEAYADQMMKLVPALGLSDSLVPIREATLMDHNEYFQRSDEIAFEIRRVLLDAADPARLRMMGWKGDISKEQQEHYLSTYRRLYPGHDERHYVGLLADYLGGSLARYLLRGSAAPPRPHAVLSLVAPVPGVPESLTSNRVYWRTLKASMARTHIAPWRAKGYLRIGEEVVPKLASWSQLPEDLHSCNTLFVAEQGGGSVNVKTDYVLA